MPAIFVPFPFATHDHQTMNARAMEQAGAIVADHDAQGVGCDIEEDDPHIWLDPVLAGDMAEQGPVYRALAARCDYPLHLGLTEAGMGSKGIVSSTAAMAVLLQDGIGDTIRISLVGDPVPAGDGAPEEPPATDEAPADPE